MPGPRAFAPARLRGLQTVCALWLTPLRKKNADDKATKRATTASKS